MAKTRSLESINKKLFKGSSSLQATIRNLLETRRPVSVLEIGCGAGRALMELASEFRHDPVAFSAINKECGNPLSSSADLRRVAKEYGVAWDDGGTAWPLPELFFHDATTLHFADDSVDLIYMSSLARFIPRKAELIEEICRVLSPGGTALIQISRSGWDYPPTPARADLLLTPHPSRFVLRYGRDLIPLPTYLRRFAERGFDFDFVSAPACVIQITKRRAGRLALGLNYDHELSVPMAQLSYGHDDVREVRGGFRSVYRISEAGYREMVDYVLARELTRREAPRSHLRLVATGSTKAAGAGRDAAVASEPEVDESEARLRALACFRVGQRVKVKGTRALGRCFCAVKIRPNDDGLEWEEMEGEIEWIDAATGTFGLLGYTVGAEANRPAGEVWERISRGELARGTLVKVSGGSQDGRFSPQRLIVKDRQAVVVEEIQGAIKAIDLADESLEVAGFVILLDERTKVVTE